MASSFHTAFIPASLALYLFAHCATPDQSPPRSPIPQPDSGRLSGYWQARDDSSYFVAFEGQSYTVAFRGQVRAVATILGLSESKIRLCEDGEETILEFTLEGPDLVLHDLKRSEVHQFQKLLQQPLSLKLLPLWIPEPTMVPADRARRIEGELGRRLQRDQVAQRERFEELWGKRRKPKDGSFGKEDLSLVAVKSENTAYLKSLITEVGWIDSRRFGSTAADAAFLLAQHSQDLPLMLAVLPRIKEEVNAGRLEGETYALLYDRIQLLLGKPQRYGTRMGQDIVGKPVVLPTEKPEKVDERRRELGMTPLSQYVGVFGASEVRFSSACLPDSR